MRLWAKTRGRRRKVGRLKTEKGFLDGIIASVKKTNRRKVKSAVRGGSKKEIKAIFDYKAFLRSRLFNVTLLIVVVYMAFLTGKEALANFYSYRQIAKIEEENNKIRDRNEESKYLLEYYKTQTFAELEARKYLNLKKKGEEVAIVPVDLVSYQTSGQEDGEGEGINLKQRTNPQKWLDFLFADISMLPDESGKVE